jgi:hypothetical protein
VKVQFAGESGRIQMNRESQAAFKPNGPDKKTRSLLHYHKQQYLPECKANQGELNRTIRKRVGFQTKKIKRDRRDGNVLSIGNKKEDNHASTFLWYHKTQLVRQE